MNGSYLEDQFSSYDIDRFKAKNSTEENNFSEEAAPPLLESSPLESEISDAAPEVVENVYIESPEMIANRAKVEENKAVYDRLLSKFNNHEQHIPKREDVEKAMSLIDDCIDEAHQMLSQDTTEISDNKRQAKKQRIVSRRLSEVIDAFFTAKYIGNCFIDIDQNDYYQYLGKCRYFLMTSMATRTFRTNAANVFKSETAQQSRDAIDKITTSTERLAMSLAEIIYSFPGDGGMPALLEKMVQKGDENTIERIGNVIRMAAKDEL